MIDGDEPLDNQGHTKYRSTVGKLQWLCPIIPVICFAATELARSLSGPTKECLAKLRHLLKYIKGVLLLVSGVCAKFVVNIGSRIGLHGYRDSDWAGCSKTRKSATGLILSTWLCYPRGSKTQFTHALSSGEAELFAMGSTTAECLHIRSFY